MASEKTLLGMDSFDFRSIIRRAMHRWSPSSDYADWECSFCGARPSTNNTDITHEKHCDGEELLRSIQD